VSNRSSNGSGPNRRVSCRLSSGFSDPRIARVYSPASPFAAFVAQGAGGPASLRRATTG
jgi:hypothetical protein